jgi:hypothetical protein
MSKQLMLGYLSVLVDVEIGFTTELPIDLNAITERMEDYGVYAYGFNVDFDVQELPDLDDVAHENRNASQANTLKIHQIGKDKTYMKPCLQEVAVEN